MQIILFIVAILLFTSLVLIHEWGHFFAARRNGVSVEEFGLGFPPRAWGKKTKGGMTLSLNWLPIGGFVRLKGEHDSDRRPGSFGAASLAAKTKILLAGVGMNLVAALAILTFLYLVGMPKLVTADQFGQDQFAKGAHIGKQEVLAIFVEKNSPAHAAGLRSLDKFISISNGSKTIAIHQPSDLQKATSTFSGERVTINFEHNAHPMTASTLLRSRQQIVNDIYRQTGLNPNVKILKFASAKNPKNDYLNLKTKDDLISTAQAYSGEKVIVTYTINGQTKTKSAEITGEGYLGVEPYNLQFIRSGWSAPVNAAGFCAQVTALSFKGLWHALSGLGSTIAGLVTANNTARTNGQSEASSQVGGPVAIFKILWSTGSIGYLYMLAIIAMISLTLAIFNVLPIPALDGGRLGLILFSRGLLRKPLSKVLEERVVATGMALLLCLTLLITIVDIKRFF